MTTAVQALAWAYWLIGPASALVAAAFVLQASPRRASGRTLVVVWLALTYLLFAAGTTLAKPLNEVAMPLASHGQYPFMLARRGAGLYGAVPYLLESPLMAVGSIALILMASTSVDWRVVAARTGWRVNGSWRWILVASGFSMVTWIFLAPATLLGWLLVLPGAAASDSPMKLHALNAASSLWVLGYVAAGWVVLRPTRGAATPADRKVWVWRSGARVLPRVLEVGLLGAGAAEALRLAPAIAVPLLGMEGNPIGPARGWTLLIVALAPLAAVSRVRWERFEGALGLATRRSVHALMVLTLGLWLLWPVRLIPYAEAISSLLGGSSGFG